MQKTGRKVLLLAATALLALTPALAYAQVASSSDATTSIAATQTSATTTIDTTATTSASSTSASTTPVAAATSTTATSTTPAAPNTNVGIQAQVQSYFADIPVMIAIAGCESGYREFDSSGNPLNGGSGGMIGIFQISQAIHAPIAQSMGMNIYTVAGNMAYARYLYQKNGTTPWLSSFACWNPIANPTSSTTGPATAALHSNLVLGAVSPEVVTLQQLLNKSTTPVASSGPGSPGEETNIFGSLTKVAVRAFQCAHSIVCSGDEYTTGYGAVGPATRTALLNLPSTTLATVPTPTGNTTVLPGSASGQDDSAQIAQLQAQIVQLEAILAQLIKARSS